MLAHGREDAQERHLRPVPLVEYEPVEPHPTRVQPDQRVVGDLPRGAIPDRVGNARGPAPRAVRIPHLGQEQVRIQEGLERALGDPDVDGHDAVVDPAEAPQVLASHARRPVALLRATGLVDHPDGAQRVVGQRVENLGHASLEFRAGDLVAPVGRDEELLQGADGGSTCPCDRLDTLARQVGQHAATGTVEVARRPLRQETVAVTRRVPGKRRPQRHDFLVRHWIPSNDRSNSPEQNPRCSATEVCGFVGRP